VSIFRWQSPAKEVVFDTLSFSHWDFFFALASFAGLYAMHRLSFIEEEGEVEESVVREVLLSVIVSPIRSLSTAAGLFQVISFPVSAVNRIRKRFL
jgi:phosphate/sulfate permease